MKARESSVPDEAPVGHVLRKINSDLSQSSFRSPSSQWLRSPPWHRVPSHDGTSIPLHMLAVRHRILLPSSPVGGFVLASTRTGCHLRRHHNANPGTTTHCASGARPIPASVGIESA